jgi:sorting nexin-1/2
LIVLAKPASRLFRACDQFILFTSDLSQSAEQFAKSVALLGSAEDHMSLSRALSHLSEVETKISQLHADQADADFFVLSELVKDYITVVQAIKVLDK